MTTDAHTEQWFGGVDSRAVESGAGCPAWYRDATDGPAGHSYEAPPLIEVLDDVSGKFGVEAVPVHYRDDEAGEFVEDARRVVLINPAWKGDGREAAPQDTAMWDVATDSYTPLDAEDVYGPLVDVANAADCEDAFGVFRTYKNGKEASVEVLFPTRMANDPDTDEPRFVLAFETGYEHGRQSVYARVMAYDRERGTAMRHLSTTFSKAHRGSAERIRRALAEWFEEMLERLDKVGETLYEVVVEARKYRTEFSGLPISPSDYYSALGFPDSYAKKAAERLPFRSDPTAWDLYDAIAGTLGDEFDGKVSGDALLGHAEAANRILYTPPAAEREAFREHARILENDEFLSGQGTLEHGADGPSAAEQAASKLYERADSLDDAVSNVLSFRDRVRAVVEGVEDELDPDDEGDEAADGEAPLVTDGGTSTVREFSVGVTSHGRLSVLARDESEATEQAVEYATYNAQDALGANVYAEGEVEVRGEYAMPEVGDRVRVSYESVKGTAGTNSCHGVVLSVSRTGPRAYRVVFEQDDGRVRLVEAEFPKRGRPRYTVSTALSGAGQYRQIGESRGEPFEVLGHEGVDDRNVHDVRNHEQFAACEGGE